MDIDDPGPDDLRGRSRWRRDFAGFVDSAGNPATIRLSLNQVGALAMTLPGLIDKALQTRFGDQSLRYAYPLASWVGRAILRSDPTHGHLADRRRLQRLLLGPARAAEPTRRGPDGQAQVGCHITGELAALQAFGFGPVGPAERQDFGGRPISVLSANSSLRTARAASRSIFR